MPGRPAQAPQARAASASKYASMPSRVRSSARLEARRLAGAALRSPLVHGLVGPSRRDLAGLPVGLRGLLQRHAAQPKFAPELVQRAGAVAGTRHPVAEPSVEGIRLERLAPLLPEGHLLIRPEHRETILTAQLVIDRLHTRSVEARVPLVDDLTGTGVVVRNGRVRVPAASLVNLVANRVSDLVVTRPLALIAPGAERPRAQTEERRHLARRHVRRVYLFYLLLSFSHNQPPPCSKSFSRNKKAPVETKEGQRRKALSISVSTGASCSLFRP